MPHFHVPKYKIDAPHVADFLDANRSSQTFSQLRSGKHEDHHIQHRANSMSPLSSVTFFTLMLALHVLQNSLRGLAMKHSKTGNSASKLPKPATKKIGDPRFSNHDYTDGDIMANLPVSTGTSTSGRQNSTRKHQVVGVLDSAELHNIKPVEVTTAILDVMTPFVTSEILSSLTADFWTSTDPLPKSKVTKGRKKVKRSLGRGHHREVSQVIQQGIQHLPIPIKIKKKKKRDPVFGSLEGLFWSIISHFLGVFTKYVSFFRDGLLPKFIKPFLPEWLVDKEPVQ